MSWKAITTMESNSTWVELYNPEGKFFGNVGMHYRDRNEFHSDNSMVLFYGWPETLECSRADVCEEIEKLLKYSRDEVEGRS